MAGQASCRAAAGAAFEGSRRAQPPTGAIYWEGLSDLVDSNGRRVGRGYLEMTGYATRLRM
jgi:predicted secreted hydrolase